MKRPAKQRFLLIEYQGTFVLRNARDECGGESQTNSLLIGPFLAAKGVEAGPARKK
jgi:hypothetical protein